MQSLDFSKHVQRMENLRSKLEAFHNTCGGALIHDTNHHLGLMVNWLKNLEYYSQHGAEFKMPHVINGAFQFVEVDQKYVDEYFTELCDNAEQFLVDNVKVT